MFQCRREMVVRQEIRVVMAWWLVREKRPQVVTVELQEVEATRRFVRREIRREHSAEPAAPCLAADERLAEATLRWAALPRARLARQA